MCGFPHHSLEKHLEKLVGLGKSVAVCDQIEKNSVQRKAADGPLKRQVTRLVTPGTVIESNLLHQKANNYLYSIFPCQANQVITVAWIDLSTGQFLHKHVTDTDRLAAHIHHVSPREILVPTDLDANVDQVLLSLSNRQDVKVTRRDPSSFASVTTAATAQNTMQTPAVAAVLNYVDFTFQADMSSLMDPKSADLDEYMEIDESARRALELDEPLHRTGRRFGDRQVMSRSLLEAIDSTATAVGARLLRDRLLHPLLCPLRINKRLDQVQFLCEHPDIMMLIRRHLRSCGDIERCVQRIRLHRFSGRDLLLLASSLRSVSTLAYEYRKKREHKGNTNQCMDDKMCIIGMETLVQLADDIDAAIQWESSDRDEEKRLIREGYDDELDQLYEMRSQRSIKMESLCSKVAEENSFARGKVRISSNSALGYFFEVPRKPSDRMLRFGKDIRVLQEMKTRVRFKSAALQELEEELLLNDLRMEQREQHILDVFRETILRESNGLVELNQTIARLDVHSAMAYLALNYGYTRPDVHDETTMTVKGGMHPTLAIHMQKKEDHEFTPNDTIMQKGESNVWLLTGPNMAGKSTFIRQVGLISIMSQMGSFVPAAKASIGIIDKVFCRVGSTDDISRDRSSFMTEMLETAHIMRTATPRSLVLMDEVGRGTAMMDGLALARAIIEDLDHRIQCRTIFATHFHELCQLEGAVSSVVAKKMLIARDKSGDLVFLHRVVDGATSDSYGIHVASLAGMPSTIIDRARTIFKSMTRVSDHPCVPRVPLTVDNDVTSHRP